MFSWLCKIIGCNHNICTETKWFGETLFQGFKCSRCNTPSTYWGCVFSMMEAMKYSIKEVVKDA